MESAGQSISRRITVNFMVGLDSLTFVIRRCRRCRLGSLRTKAVPGEGPQRAKVFFIGEAPGKEEDLTGRPFVGAAGKILTSALKAAGARREEVFITSVNKCRPPGNRRPRSDEVAACRPYLVEQIDEVRPSVIVVLGQHSFGSLLALKVGISNARRSLFLYHGMTVVPTYHPAAILYNRRLQASFRFDILRAIEIAQIVRKREGGMEPVRGKPFEIRLSAGVVPWDRGRGFLLIRRRDEGIWAFPKGTVEKGERLEETALRELCEEAGLRGKILADLGAVFYRFYDAKADVNCRKSVHYFLAKTPARPPRLEAMFEDSRWCLYPQAARLLHYENDLKMLMKARDAARVLP